MSETRVAVLGAGLMGTRHIKTLKELKVLDFVYDPSPDAVGRTRKIVSSNTVVSQHYSDVFFWGKNHGSNTAVVVATPAATHYKLGKVLLTRGHDVLIEKPLALTAKEAADLCEIAHKNNKVLMVGHLLEYHRGFLRLKAMADQGLLGKLHSAHATRVNFGTVRTEENVLWSLGPHDISMFMSLFGKPSHVSATGQKIFGNYRYDSVSATLFFKDNQQAALLVSWNHPEKEQRLTLKGSDASAVLNDVTKSLKIMSRPFSLDTKLHPKLEKGPSRTIWLDHDPLPLAEELKHFLKCCETRETSRTDGQQGLAVLKIIEAMERSMWGHGEPEVLRW